MLNGAIFSLYDVLLIQGSVDAALFEETIRLLRYLQYRRVKPVFVGNHDWTITSAGQSRPFRELLEERLGPVSYYVGGRDGMPSSPERMQRSIFWRTKAGTGAVSFMLGTASSTCEPPPTGS